MSDTQPTPAPAPGAGPQAGEEPARPVINVVAQYIKDISFENPNAPASLALNAAAPEIAVNVQVNAEALKDGSYEVALHISAKAQHGQTTAFVAELTYAGQFSISNATRDLLPAILLIECPRMLFPFARRVIADATRDGGYPPLLLNPIDFLALFRQQRLAAQQQQQQQQQSNAGG